MINWVDFLKELEVAAVEPGIVVQNLNEEKPQVLYQEELELEVN